MCTGQLCLWLPGLLSLLLTCTTVCGECPEQCLCIGDSDSCFVCREGYFGRNCQDSCSPNCLDSQCSQLSRRCSACVDGFYGSQCDKRCQCSKGKCEQMSGHCRCRGICEPGCSTYCDTDSDGIRNDAPLTIGILAATVMIFVFIVIIIKYLRRHQQSRSSAGVVLHTVPPSQKYMQPDSEPYPASPTYGVDGEYPGNSYPNSPSNPMIGQPYPCPGQPTIPYQRAPGQPQGEFYQAVDGGDAAVAVPSAPLPPPPGPQGQNKPPPPSYESIFKS